MYAIKDTIPANIPFNLCRLNKISPVAKNNKIMPAKEIHIFNNDKDKSITSVKFHQMYK